MKAQFDDYKGTVPILLLALILVYMIYINATKYKGVFPRQQNGKGYLHSEDSVYQISFTIDTVFANEYEPED